MATGKRAFQRETAVQTLSAIIESEPEPLETLNPDLLALFVSVVESLLEKSPERRYKSTRSLVLDLEEARDGVLKSASRLSAPSPARKQYQGGSRLCPECSQDNPLDQKYCGKCGSLLERTCPQCGKGVVPGTMFCGQCGHSLSPVPQSAQPPASPPSTPSKSSQKSSSGSLLEGERRQATIVSSNLAGYAALVEQLGPEELEDVMQRISEAATEVVDKHGGKVNQFEGGMLMALFGIPTAHEDDFHRAVRAVLELHARVRELNADLERRLGQRLRMHTGVDTGHVVTQLLEGQGGKYRVLGDAVQGATRLVALAEEDEILVSPKTERLITPFFETEARDPVVLQGKSQPVTPYRVSRESQYQTRLEAAERSGLTNYTGREKEMGILERSLESAFSGEGRFVTAVGEAGVGKSRLLHEFRKALTGKPVTVLEGRCELHGCGVPYLPFIQALRHGLRLLIEDPHALEANAVSAIRDIDPALEHYIPFYLYLLSIKSDRHSIPKHLEGEELQLAMLEALSAIFTASSKRESVVLLLEDWHWADEASKEALRQLVGMVSAHPLLIVATYRPEYRSDWGVVGHHTSVHLGPLDGTSSLKIIQSVMGTSVLPEGLGALIHERTGGNPFFIEELCHTLREEGTIEVVDEEVVLAGTLESLQLPETVQAVIRTRLDRLDRETQEVARVASVIGREFDRRILGRTLPDKSKLGQSLETLKTSGIIQQIRVLPEAAYLFKHVLTQEVVYKGLLLHQRKALHGKAGQVIEDLYADRIEEVLDLLMHHFSRAENWHKAVHYGRESSKRASKLSRFADALTILEKSQSWLLKLPEDKSRQETLIDTLLEQERACETLGARERQQTIVGQLHKLLESTEDRARLAEVYIREGELQIQLGQFDDAERALGRSLDIRRDLSDQLGERNTLRSMGYLRWRQEEYEKAVALNEAALAIDREMNDVEAIAIDLTNLGQVLRSLGAYGRALEHLEEAIRLHDTLRNPFQRGYTLVITANVYRNQGDNEKAMHYLQQAAEIQTEHRLTMQQAFTFTSMANIHWDQGHIEESLRLYKDLVQKNRDVKYAEGLSHSLLRLSERLLSLDKPEEALPHLLESTTVLRQLGDPQLEASAWSKIASIYEKDAEKHQDGVEAWGRVRHLRKQTSDLLGELEALEGMARVCRKIDPLKALEHRADALELATKLDDRPKQGDLLNSMGITEWSRGNYAGALERYEQALDIFRELDDQIHAGLILNSIGVTLKHLQRQDEARARLEEALQVNRQTGERLLEGHSLAALGDVDSEAGNREDALQHYRASLEIRREIDDRKGEGWMLHKLARVYASQGEQDEARDYSERASAIAAECQDQKLKGISHQFQDSLK